MAIVDIVEIEKADEPVKEAINRHVAQGYRVTNEKLTLLHNVTCFEALEVQSYKVDKELQRIVGKRAADLFEYAISLENDCLVCSTYFEKLLKRNGIENFDDIELTNTEKILVEFARAIATDVKNIPEDLYERLKVNFTQEEIVIITTMGVFMIANNYFNDILKVKSEMLL